MSRAEDLFDQLVKMGLAQIEHMVATQHTEHHFLDYKRSANDGDSDYLNQTDRNNFSKCASGFGNSEGGVIVWGVDCKTLGGKGDVPHTTRPILTPIRFKSLLEQATTGVTIPAHSAIMHEAITIPAEDRGFVVTLVPAGVHAPYQAMFDNNYYIRSGSNFAKAPHGVLAGLFGRRPAPLIRVTAALGSPMLVGHHHEWIGVTIRIELSNQGHGIAEDVWFNIDASIPGSGSEIRFGDLTPVGVWGSSLSTANSIYRMAERDFRLAPGISLDLGSHRFLLRRPYDADLRISIAAGSAASPAEVVEFRADRMSLEEADANFRLSPHDFPFNDTWRLIRRV